MQMLENLTIREEIVRIINEQRQKAELLPLQLNSQACIVADEHCQEMNENHFTSSWNIAGEKVYQRYQRHGIFSNANENTYGIDASDPSCLFETSSESILSHLQTAHESFMQDENTTKEKQNVLNENATEVGIGFHITSESFRCVEVYLNAYISELAYKSDSNVHSIQGYLNSESGLKLLTCVITNEHLPQVKTVEDIRIAVQNPSSIDGENVHWVKACECSINQPNESESSDALQSFEIPLGMEELKPGKYTAQIYLTSDTEIISAVNCADIIDTAILQKSINAANFVINYTGSLQVQESFLVDIQNSVNYKGETYEKILVNSTKDSEIPQMNMFILKKDGAFLKGLKSSYQSVITDIKVADATEAPDGYDILEDTFDSGFSKFIFVKREKISDIENSSRFISNITGNNENEVGDSDPNKLSRIALNFAEDCIFYLNISWSDISEIQESSTTLENNEANGETPEVSSPIIALDDPSPAVEDRTTEEKSCLEEVKDEAQSSAGSDIDNSEDDENEDEFVNNAPEGSSYNHEVDEFDRLEKILQQAMIAKEQLIQTNGSLQRSILPLLQKKQENTSGTNELAKDDHLNAVENEKRYHDCLNSVHETRSQLANAQSQYDQIAMDLQSRLDDKEYKSNEIQVSFLEFKREIAKNAENSRTGKPIPRRLTAQFEAAEAKKDQEVEKVRLKNINLRTHLRKLEQQLRAKEQLAEGLHLIDFEQLKIENQTLNEKIEERNEELHKLRKKTTTTVQILTHFKEKLQFVHAENSNLKIKLSDLDEDLTSHRDKLTKSKKEKDTLRNQNHSAKQKQGFVNSQLLVQDYQTRSEELETMENRLMELKQKYAYLTKQSKDLSKTKQYNAMVLT